MRSVFENRGGKPSERANPFSLMKPKGNGPLEAGARGRGKVDTAAINPRYMLPPRVNERIVHKVKGLGWDKKFAKKILKLKRELFKDDSCFSEEVEGQIFSANFNLKIEGVDVSLTVNKEYAYVHIKKTSEKKRVSKIDELCRIFENHLPGIELKRSRTPLEHTNLYLVTVHGKLYHPKAAERNKKIEEIIKHRKDEKPNATVVDYHVGAIEGC